MFPLNSLNRSQTVIRASRTDIGTLVRSFSTNNLPVSVHSHGAQGLLLHLADYVYLVLSSDRFRGLQKWDALDCRETLSKVAIPSSHSSVKSGSRIAKNQPQPSALRIYHQKQRDVTLFLRFRLQERGK